MANFTAAQKREHAVLTKIQNELAFMADRQTMTVAGSTNSSVPLVFNLDAFELTDGNIDFTPASHEAPADIPILGVSTPSQIDGAGPDSLEWFSRLLQNAARAS